MATSTFYKFVFFHKMRHLCHSSMLNFSLLLLLGALFLATTSEAENSFVDYAEYHICLPTAMDCSALGLPDYLVACFDCRPPNSRGVCNQGQFVSCSEEVPVSCTGDCRPLAKGAKIIGSEGGPEDGDDGTGGGGQDDGSYNQENDWSNGNGNSGNNNGQWDGNY